MEKWMQRVGNVCFVNNVVTMHDDCLSLSFYFLLDT